MARKPRSSLPDYGIFHVTQRGVDRVSIVRDDEDREAFARRRAEVERRFGWKTLAWCLLDNHFHLVVETWREALSAGMHRLGFMHAQRFNERHRRTGHLFQGRFRARVLTPDDDAELERVCAYVRANAERHGLCRARGDWPWRGGRSLGRLLRPVQRGERRRPGPERQHRAARPFRCGPIRDPVSPALRHVDVALSARGRAARGKLRAGPASGAPTARQRCS